MDKSLAHDDAILQARAVLDAPYVIVDTETTGLKEPEAVQVGVVEADGTKTRLLVKPVAPIEPTATLVHGITNEMVDGRPALAQIWASMSKKITTARFVGYNASFDVQAINRSLQRGGIPDKVNEKTVFDVMLCYAAFAGEINRKYGTFKWHKLGEALLQCGIDFTQEYHDALSDAEATLLLLQFMAEQPTSWELALIAAATLCSRFGVDGSDEVIEFNRCMDMVTYRRYP